MIYWALATVKGPQNLHVVSSGTFGNYDNSIQTVQHSFADLSNRILDPGGQTISLSPDVMLIVYCGIVV